MSAVDNLLRIDVLLCGFLVRGTVSVHCDGIARFSFPDDNYRLPNPKESTIIDIGLHGPRELNVGPLYNKGRITYDDLYPVDPRV